MPPHFMPCLRVDSIERSSVVPDPRRSLGGSTVIGRRTSPNDRPDRRARAPGPGLLPVDRTGRCGKVGCIHTYPQRR